jgi:hexosaminidase
MPGHSRAALAAYPEYSCNNIQQPVPGLWGVYDDIYCTKEASFQFIESILEEVVNLFPGEYIHIGGDEAPKTRWKHCENCQNRIKENNLKDEEALQSYFIKRIDRFLSKKNKKLIGWDEILEGGLSPNATVMSWRGMKGGIEAAKKSHYVVMTPGSHCYFDHYQSKSKDEPLAIGGFTPLEKVYNFNPIPSELNTNESYFILGGQANLWTEYIPNMKQLEYMAYPRAIALSQSLWCHDKPSYHSFFNNLTETHFAFLDLLNVNYSRSCLKPSIDVTGVKNGISIKVNAYDSTDKYKTQIIENDTIIEVFDLKSGQPLSIKSTEKNVKMTNVKFTSTINKISSDINIMRHLGLGATINYITEPNPQYNYNKSLLTDGLHGERPWRGHEWIGFDSSKIVFEIELAARKKVNHININFLKSNGSWIYLPTEVIIYKKGLKRWRLCKSRKIKNEKTKFKINRRIRKLRFVIRTHDEIPINLPGAGHKPWTFIDEIEFH